MLRFEQLAFTFGLRELIAPPVAAKPAKPLHGRDAELEATAAQLLRAIGAPVLAARVRVEWNPRLRTAAGRAACRAALVSLNPRLREHGAGEIDRTLRHELAHLLAQARAGRRRLAPHGPQWRQACCDLGVPGEPRCHTLPFPPTRRARRFLYRCPGCAREFPRVRRLKRAAACSECCRQHNGGWFTKRFQLALADSPSRIRTGEAGS